MVTEAEQLQSAVKVGAARALRQSLLNSADICLRRAQYDLKPPGPRRTSEAALRGTGYHAALELYYNERAEAEHYGVELQTPDAELTERMLTACHNTIVHEIELYDATLITWDTSPKGCIETAQQMVGAYFDQGHQWGAEYTVVGTEVPFWLPSPYPGWVSHGTIDLVLEGPDPCAPEAAPSETGEVAPSSVRGVILDDHKTAGRKWDAKKHTTRKTAQVPTYWEAWEQMTGTYPLAFSFSIQQKNGQFERRLVRPEKAELDAFRLKRDQTVQLLSSGLELPGNPTSNLCSSKWCAWWQVCPWGESFGV